MKRLLILLGASLGLLVLGLGGLLGWAGWRLADDRAAASRPVYPQTRFSMQAHVPDGSTPPGPTGLHVDSAGRAHILPPLPPEKPMDISTAANIEKNAALKSCFWPGPRARSGVYTNDMNSFAGENQLPDTSTTYVPAFFILPEGAELVVTGDFPHMRHWNLNTYDMSGYPQDVISDRDIEPDAGSFNPFRADVRRDVQKRRYTLHVRSGKPPAQRAPNILYTYADAGQQASIWMRYYVPDLSTDYLGGVGLPQVALRLADGKVLTGQAACDATAAPLRGKQVPPNIDPRLWVGLAQMPWVSTDNVGAQDEMAVPMQVFFNRTQVATSLFLPWLSQSEPKQLGGFWSNLATRYGYAVLSRNFGKIYVMTGKMPTVPKTWHGDVQNDPQAEMRYMSVCTSGAPPAGTTVDCIYDEQLAASLDPAGNYYVVISRLEERPQNATEACGVSWIEFGNGDGLPSGSANFSSVINRHTQVNPSFKHSWFAVDKPGQERQAMGVYLPHVLNLKETARFEALGCPVDKTRLQAMLPPAG